MHLTPLSRFRRIMASGRLLPQTCPTLKQDILYCSYGDPVHRPSRKETEWHFDPPVALLLSPTLLRTRFGFAPLDTGAIAAGRVPWFPARVRDRMAADYCVADNNAELLSAWVGSIYGGDDGYMSRSALDISSGAPEEVLVARLLGMAATDWAMPDHQRDDMRVISQVECHFFEPVRLDSHLLAAFLPTEIRHFSWSDEMSRTVGHVAKGYRGCSLNGNLPPELLRLVRAGVVGGVSRVH